MRHGGTGVHHQPPGLGVVRRRLAGRRPRYGHTSRRRCGVCAEQAFHGVGATPFVDGMHTALYCSAALALLTGPAALVTLRNVPKVIPEYVEQSDRDIPAFTSGA